MSDFTKVAAAADIPSGSKKVVFAAGKHVMIANIGGEFFAVDDTCTHAQCSLGGEGFLDGNTITCGCHGGQFDITTGKVLALPPTVDLATYETKVEGNDLLIKV